MPAAVRPQLTLSFEWRLARRRPPIEVVKHTLRPGGGLATLDALVATPPEPKGVLVYFPGFNTPLGPWETAKCQYLADATSMHVVLSEIPGMSRYGHPIPKAVRSDMLRKRPEPWAELNLAYIAAALEAGGITETEHMQALGYSTGCSLAAAALPALAEWGPIEGLNLVEPVAISKRNLASLHAHNMADFGRMPVALATNLGHDWVMSAYRGQRREPNVKYSATDLLAIATVLASEELGRRMDEVELARCALARGSRSSLCRRKDFDAMDASLAGHGVPGPTITVDGLGHQLWHSFPALTQLIDAMLVGP
ncbi:MAG: hypothetical protein QM779_10690 [Propionicimonas sp.]|uniref:hypothetical protein n=1 Tax=Propionicimonas sp. TaxID=1955623 RepID=UPI003D0E4BDA